MRLTKTLTKVLLPLLAAVLLATPAWAGDITVSAAASLTDAFTAMGAAYEKQYPDSKVVFNFAASGALLQQIAKGAPVDVFASADQTTMDTAESQGLILSPSRRDFARNDLVLAVPLNSQANVHTIQDITGSSVTRIAIGNPDSVPAGRYAKAALEHAGLWDAAQAKAVFAQNVRQALDYVAREEVDVAFVYATDAEMMKGKVNVAGVVALEKSVLYPIAAVADSKNQEEALRFVDFVSAPQGQAILQQYGFANP